MSGAIITMRQASPLSNRSFDCHGNQLSLSWPPLVLHVIFGVWGALIMHNQRLGEEGIMANPGVSGTRTASEKVSMGDRLDCRRMRLLLSMQAMNLLPNAILLLELRFPLPWEFKWWNGSRQAGGDLWEPLAKIKCVFLPKEAHARNAPPVLYSSAHSRFLYLSLVLVSESIATCLSQIYLLCSFSFRSPRHALPISSAASFCLYLLSTADLENIQSSVAPYHLLFSSSIMSVHILISIHAWEIKTSKPKLTLDSVKTFSCLGEFKRDQTLRFVCESCFS